LASVETSMQTWAAIESRRNVRSFTGQPIPAEDLDQILEAGRRSPSSQNWQPWDFILVTDRERLRELAEVWRGAGHVAGSAATIVGSCHAGVADLELARDLLGFLSDRNWAFLISLGYPADRPLTPVKTPKRRPFSE
jgi:nitroreductase